jgi:hypothetical protein
MTFPDERDKGLAFKKTTSKQNVDGRITSLLSVVFQLFSVTSCIFIYIPALVGFQKQKRLIIIDIPALFCDFFGAEKNSQAATSQTPRKMGTQAPGKWIRASARMSVTQGSGWHPRAHADAPSPERPQSRATVARLFDWLPAF